MVTTNTFKQLDYLLLRFYVDQSIVIVKEGNKEIIKTSYADLVSLRKDLPLLLSAALERNVSQITIDSVIEDFNPKGGTMPFKITGAALYVREDDKGVPYLEATLWVEGQQTHAIIEKWSRKFYEKLGLGINLAWVKVTK
jgi:hypothetical protein